MSEKRQVLRAAGIVGAFTLFSRFTGLLRDMVLTRMIGAGAFADTFNNAFELVNQARRILGEGALSSFIVPIYSERRHESPAAGWQFFNRTLNVMAGISALIAIVGMLFPREFYLLCGGFGQLASGQEALVEHGTRMTRLMFPYVIGISASAAMMGVCHALSRFTAPSLGSVMLNLTMIATGLLALALKVPQDTGTYWLCWAVLAGVGLRVAIMVPTLRGAGWRWRIEFNWSDPGLRKLFVMMGLGLVGMSLSQINYFVSGFFANYAGVGVKSSLVWANRLIQFPMALTATAIATAMLPQLARYLLEGRGAELREMMAFIKRLEIVCMMPAIIGLMVFGYPIVELLFEGRAFTATDTHATWLALLAYAPGLLALGWIRILQTLYYARQDTLTPLKAGVWSVALNVALNWYFAFHTNLDQVGLGAANTVASYLNYFLMAWYLRGELAARAGEQPRIGETTWKTLLASLIACGLGYGGYTLLHQYLGAPTHALSRAALLLPILAGVAGLYFALTHALRVPDADEAMQRLTRKLRRRKK